MLTGRCAVSFDGTSRTRPEGSLIASLVDFLPTHNTYLTAYSEAVVTGDCSILDPWLSPHYQLVTCDRASNQITILERDMAMLRVQNAILNVRGGFHRVGGRVMHPRAHYEMVVSFESQLGTRMQVQSSMTTQTWRFEETRWWLVREMIERNTETPEIVYGAVPSLDRVAATDKMLAEHGGVTDPDPLTTP
jgi:hypothetical protein